MTVETRKYKYNSSYAQEIAIKGLKKLLGIDYYNKVCQIYDDNNTAMIFNNFRREMVLIGTPEGMEKIKSSLEIVLDIKFEQQTWQTIQ